MGLKRGRVLAGNWKMNHLAGDTRAFFTELGALATARGLGAKPTGEHLQVVVFPSFLSLDTAIRSAKETPPQTVQIGAQNAHFAPSGAFTGEVSIPMLKEVGASWLLIGHSERREHFLEPDALLSKKVSSSLDAGLKTLFCLGEMLADREGGQTHAVLDRQLKGALSPLPSERVSEAMVTAQLQLAYEPVWAIGTGRVATPSQAEEAHAYLRQRIAAQWGESAAGHCKILYGGSVKPENIGEILTMGNVDGALVGGASLTAKSFADLWVEFVK